MDFQTDPYICNYMVLLLPDGVKTVLEPTPGKGNLVKALAGYSVTAPKEFWSYRQGLTDRFDAVVMNPPFSPMMTSYRILFSVMELSDVIVAVMPWLSLINSTRRTKAIKKFGLKAVTHLPRSAFKGSRVQTCILEMIKGYDGVTSLYFMGDTV